MRPMHWNELVLQWPRSQKLRHGVTWEDPPWEEEAKFLWAKRGLPLPIHAHMCKPRAKLCCNLETF